VNLAGFRNCLAAYTMHSLSPCYEFLTALVLLNSVAIWCNAPQFVTKKSHFTCLCAFGVGRNFSRGVTSGFFQKFLRGAKRGEIWFLPLEIKKNSIFYWNFQIPAHLPTPICFCVGKVCAKPQKIWGNFKRFNTIRNSKILLNLIRKWNIWQINFNCVFVFAL